MQQSENSYSGLPGITAEMARFLEGWDGEQAYAMATIVRTAGATAGRAGAKAIVTAEGDLIGFVGGGCLRSAILKAGRTAIETGAPQYVRSAPKDALTPGGNVEGLQAYASGCPSKGEADVFVEPVLPQVPVAIFGEGDLAEQLETLAAAVGLAAQRVSCGETLTAIPGLERGFAVVATQGVGDKAALEASLSSTCRRVLFVASAKKAAHWRSKLEKNDALRPLLAKLVSPAGLPIKAASPSEIAVSILAQLIEFKNEPASSAAHGTGEVA